MAPRESASQRHAGLLKQKTLDALTRLGHRDTARVAVHELTRLISSMPPEHLPVVLQCLCDESAAAPKATARREVLRLFETLMDTQGEHALPHLPRLVNATIRRIKDPDSLVGDAVVEVIGSLAVRVSRMPGRVSRAVLSGPDAIGPHFVRPVLEALHETNSRGAQDVACRVLARVFRKCGPGKGGANVPTGVNWYPDGGPSSLALKLGNMLHAPNFYAKAQLVQAITALFASAAFAVGPRLPALLGVGAKDADTVSNDWKGLIDGDAVRTTGGAFADDTSNAHVTNENAVGTKNEKDDENDDANANGTAEADTKESDDRTNPETRARPKNVAANVGDVVSTSSGENFELIPGGLLDAVGAFDWPVRRAAAESLTVLLCDLGPGLENDTITPIPLVDAIESALRSHMHDKVKPARDAVLTALAVVDALRRYALENLPLHDIAMWRRWVRAELGEEIGSLGEDGRCSFVVDRKVLESPQYVVKSGKENACENHLSDGIERVEKLASVREAADGGDGKGAPGVKNNFGAKQFRGKQLSSAFRLANSGDIVIKVAPRAKRVEETVETDTNSVQANGHLVQANSQVTKQAEAPSETTKVAEDAAREPVQTPRGMGNEGNTYEVASSDGDDEPREVDDVGEGNLGTELGEGINPLPSTALPVTPARESKKETNANAEKPPPVETHVTSDDEDAPEWMRMASSIERDGGFGNAVAVLPAQKRAATTPLPPPVPDVGPDDLSVLDDDEAYDDGLMVFAPPTHTHGGKVKQQQLQQQVRHTSKAELAIETRFEAQTAALELVREQMRSMAASQSDVLTRIGDFVNTCSTQIERLSTRVDKMENQVGVAVTAAATVANAATRMADRDNTEALRLSSRAASLSAARATEAVKLALAKDRADLEEEKAQLRLAAAQLERAAAQLERVVPERREPAAYPAYPGYEGYE